MSNKLVLSGVSKAFGTNQVLNDVSLSINAGEVISFIGAALIFLAVTIPLTRFTDYLLTRERDRTGASKVR